MIFFIHSQGTILSANAGRRQPPQGPCDTANFEVCMWIYLPGEFHLHLARFVPRSSAGAVNFQAYLLDGITRWNLARSAAAVQHDTTQTLRTFNSWLQNQVNQLSQSILGEVVLSHYQPRSHLNDPKVRMWRKCCSSPVQPHIRKQPHCPQEHSPWVPQWGVIMVVCTIQINND